MHAAARSAPRRRRRQCTAEDAPALHWNVSFSSLKKHSVSSALLHKLAFLDVKPQVQRLHNGVGRGCFNNSDLTSGIIMTWDAQACLLAATKTPPRPPVAARPDGGQQLLDLEGLRVHVRAGQRPGYRGPSRDAVEHLMRRARSRVARLAEALEAQASDEEEAAADERIAARVRDLVTLDNAVLGPHDSGATFEANKKVFIVHRGNSHASDSPVGPAGDDHRTLSRHRL